VRAHYENFPVASRLLPRRLRQPIAVIYAFARTADDIADEGALDAETRLTRLAEYDHRLDTIAAGETPDEPIFLALADVIRRHALPLRPLHDLLTAFRRDVSTRRHADFPALLDYCRYSANPIGRLLLHLMQADSAQNLAHSDAICSALQLINFLQDIAQDYHENDRIYLPQDEMARFGVDDSDIAAGRSSPALRRLLQHQIQRARAMMREGQPLGCAVGGRFGLQLRMTINGGLRILDRLEARQDDLFGRPRLRRRDWLWMVYHSL